MMREPAGNAAGAEDAGRKAAALTAIIQTLLPEICAGEGEPADARLLLQMAAQCDPVSMAIANELTPEEIAAAFDWRDRGDGSMEAEIRVMPVMSVLDAEQREAVRVTWVAELAADRVLARAQEENGSGKRQPSSTRMRRYDALFLETLAADVADQRGTRPYARTEASAEAGLEALPEPWRSKGAGELVRLRRCLRALLRDERAA